MDMLQQLISTPFEETNQPQESASKTFAEAKTFLQQSETRIDCSMDIALQYRSDIFLLQMSHYFSV